MAQFKNKFSVSTLLFSLLFGLSFAAHADDIKPSDVEGVVATPGDGEVTISWDPATDNLGVEGYMLYSGLSSVTENGGSYTFGAIDVGDTTSYTMQSLSNNVTYYFAVTAYDDTKNESEFFSDEVSATPEESQVGDFTGPTVQAVVASTNTLVEVEFSESVVLPEDAESAFSIEKPDESLLEIVSAYVSAESNTVFLLTEEQTASHDYILTVGIGVTDLAGNPVESGTSDTGIFSGSSLGGEALEEGEHSDEEGHSDEEHSDEEGHSHDEEGHSHDEEGEHSEESSDKDFGLDNVEATSLTSLKLEFSQSVAAVSLDSFEVQRLDDASIGVEVLAVSIDDNENNVVTLVVEEMQAGFQYVISADESVLNADSASLTLSKNNFEFQAPLIDLADLLPPEDVTEFLASLNAFDPSAVTLSWSPSVDSAGDLANYLLYESLNGGSFDAPMTLAKELTSTSVEGLTPGESYTFKVTAVDENGNESIGVMTTIVLPETGPGMIALGGLSLLGAGAMTRRRKEKL